MPEVAAKPTLTDEELLTIVCHLFLQPMGIKQIVEYIKRHYAVPRFTREAPYRILAKAAAEGRFTLVSAERLDELLAALVRKRYPGLNTVDVVESAWLGDIAEQAARTILAWLRHMAAAGTISVRIGLMGGSTVQSVCRCLARSLAKLTAMEQQSFPELILQALAVGDDVRQPLEDPASFFTYFADAPLPEMKFRFIGIHAPVFLSPGTASSTFYPGSEFEQLQVEARTCDLVLVSAGEFADDHSFLGSLKADPATQPLWNILDANFCRGDLGRLPLSQDGSMDLGLFSQPPCTLINLEDFQAIVERKGRVMVIAAPCASCKAPKSSILRTLLELRRAGLRLFSDLVCDAGSARGIGTLGQVR